MNNTYLVFVVYSIEYCQGGSGMRAQLQIGERFKRRFILDWQKGNKTKGTPKGGKRLWKKTSAANRLTKGLQTRYQSYYEEETETQKWQTLSSGRGHKTRLWIMGWGYTDSHERNTLATRTREDMDYIHRRRGDIGGNNQGSGETSDQWHRRKGKSPETRGKLHFKKITRQKKQGMTSLTTVCQI